MTQNPDYLRLDPSHVMKWEDFTYDNIKAAYRHLFNIGPIQSNAPSTLTDSQSEIEKEGHVDDMVLLWNQQVCRLPLKHGAQRVQTDLGAERRDLMKRLGTSKDPASDSKAKAPDWCIFLRDPRDPQHRPRTVLV